MDKTIDMWFSLGYARFIDWNYGAECGIGSEDGKMYGRAWSHQDDRSRAHSDLYEYVQAADIPKRMQFEMDHSYLPRVDAAMKLHDKLLPQQKSKEDMLAIASGMAEAAHKKLISDNEADRQATLVTEAAQHDSEQDAHDMAIYTSWLRGKFLYEQQKKKQ